MSYHLFKSIHIWFLDKSLFLEKLTCISPGGVFESAPLYWLCTSTGRWLRAPSGGEHSELQTSIELCRQYRLHLLLPRLFFWKTKYHSQINSIHVFVSLVCISEWFLSVLSMGLENEIKHFSGRRQTSFFIILNVIGLYVFRSILTLKPPMKK